MQQHKKKSRLEVEKLHAQLRELKKKHSRELAECQAKVEAAEAECQAKVEAAEAKIRDLEEQLDAQERKHKTMKLEATVEALKEQLAAFKKAAHVAVATPAGTTYTATPRSQTPLVPAMPASATASKTTPYDPARPGGLVPTTTPTPYDPARPGGGTANPNVGANGRAGAFAAWLAGTTSIAVHHSTNGGQPCALWWVREHARVDALVMHKCTCILAICSGFNLKNIYIPIRQEASG